jgi:hypothetical protein
MKLGMLEMAIAVFIANNIHAQVIGWTLDECKSHWGNYTSRVSQSYGVTVYDFHQGDETITVLFADDNKAILADFWKKQLT